jgi:hypothetical protein
MGDQLINAPQGGSVSYSEQFKALCAKYGVTVTFVKAGGSVGSSLLSIDTGDEWRLSKPLVAPLREVLAVYEGLGPKGQNLLDTARRRQGLDALITITDLAFSDFNDFSV